MSCEHDEAKMIDEYQEIGDSNNIAITQWFECACGAKGTRMYIIPAQINWGSIFPSVDARVNTNE